MIENIDPKYLWLALLILWMLPWKGWALWRAAKNNQRIWFSALMILQTMAVLEILYLLFFQKKRK